MNLETALMLVGTELTKAQAQHGPMHSAHEGWAVIQEEMDELWEVVRRKREARGGDLRKEAVQVAAMGLRFLLDLCEPGVVIAEPPLPWPTLFSLDIQAPSVAPSNVGSKQ